MEAQLRHADRGPSELEVVIDRAPMWFVCPDPAAQSRADAGNDRYGPREARLAVRQSDQTVLIVLRFECPQLGLAQSGEGGEGGSVAPGLAAMCGDQALQLPPRQVEM